MAIDGRCLCEAIQFEVTGEGTSRSLCHCSQCRRAHGATPVAWVTFPRASLGLIAGAPRWYRSSDHARRGFCGDCGSSLFFEDAREPDSIDVATAILDAPERFAPERHIWVDSGVAWARPADGLPAHPERGDS